MAYALVTGASKGIGKCIAEELASRGFDLLIIARSESLLKDLSQDLQKRYNRTVNYLALDLTKKESLEKIVQYVSNQKLPIQVLVNNAGYGLWGRFDQLQLSQFTDMMQINLNCMVSLTHLLLPTLKQQKESYILNISSTSAYQAVPTLSVYCASKSFVVLFSRALRRELKDSGVSVSCLSPGPTDTNFMNAAGMTSPGILKQAKRFNMNPADVARFGVNGLFRKKNEMIPGFVNKISVWLTYFVPKNLTEKVAEGLYK